MLGFFYKPLDEIYTRWMSVCLGNADDSLVWPQQSCQLGRLSPQVLQTCRDCLNTFLHF